MALPSFIHFSPESVFLSIKLQPRASANEVGEALGNELRVKVTAAPVDRAANEALIKLLAKHFDCPRSSVELVRGHISRHKVVRLRGISAERIIARLS